MTRNKLVWEIALAAAVCLHATASAAPASRASSPMIVQGAIWPDDKGVHINAHGGGMLLDKGVYYWFGELPLPGEPGRFIFMADRWRPENPIDGRYVWLPVEWENDLPVLRWQDRWSPKILHRGK